MLMVLTLTDGKYLLIKLSDDNGKEIENKAKIHDSTSKKHDIHDYSDDVGEIAGNANEMHDTVPEITAKSLEKHDYSDDYSDNKNDIVIIPGKDYSDT
jgi:hypothetical protein